VTFQYDHVSTDLQRRVRFTLTVHDVTSGPAEIDLDDTRAIIPGFNHLQGHVSIGALSLNCQNTTGVCTLSLAATFSLSAVSAANPDPEMLTVTSGTIDLHEDANEVPAMCEGF
jgi:hypothetical protein